MVIYTGIDTEEKIVAVWTDDSLDYYCEYDRVEFDVMTIQEIVNDVKEYLKK